MNTMHQGIVTLMKSAVTGESLPLPEDFRLEDGEELIRMHSLVPLCYEGAGLCGIPADSAWMKTNFKSYCQNLICSEGQLAQIRRLFAAFDANGIDYLPLKGVNMKPRYPKPELRVMGDADILIKTEQYKKPYRLWNLSVLPRRRKRTTNCPGNFGRRTHSAAG